MKCRAHSNMTEMLFVTLKVPKAKSVSSAKLYSYNVIESDIGKLYNTLKKCIIVFFNCKFKLYDYAFRSEYRVEPWQYLILANIIRRNRITMKLTRAITVDVYNTICVKTVETIMDYRAPIHNVRKH